tara:strand:- start:719 stop:1276 length:558 start_codon:yes stop_codon:yes gene_type:complete
MVYNYFSVNLINLINYIWHYDIILIKNNKIIKKSNFNKLNEIPDYDYIVINYKNDKYTLVKIIENISELTGTYGVVKRIEMLKTIPVECCFKFILVLLKTNKKTYDITKYLNNRFYTFYLENGILFDENFINWICIKFIKNKDLLKLKKEIFIIDQHAKQITLSDKQHIILGSNNYGIYENKKLK